MGDPTLRVKDVAELMSVHVSDVEAEMMMLANKSEYVGSGVLRMLATNPLDSFTSVAQLIGRSLDETIASVNDSLKGK